MKSIPDCLVVYSNDVRNITGRCYRSSRFLLQHIRQLNGRTKGLYVTLQEFCKYMDMDEEFVRAFLKNG